MNKRLNGIGFWYYPIKGIPTPSKPWMSELLQAQKEGRDIADSSRLRLDAGNISRQYLDDEFPGHSAWLDWPWKLHRIQKENSEILWELYNLNEDPGEGTNLADKNSKRIESMKPELEQWLYSVVQSLNGKDYQ
jgi:hypothetical protein